MRFPVPAPLLNPAPQNWGGGAFLALALTLLGSTSAAAPTPPPAPLPSAPSYVTELARQQYARERGFKFNKIIRGDTRRLRVALTFDDGPHPAMTVKLLNILRRAHVPVTFFVVGREVERSPALVRLEVADGHEIGNHTYDHVSLTRIPPALVPYEMNACTAAIEKATGAPVRFFRPPGGDYDGATLREAAAHGYITTLWTDDPGDFMKPGAAVILKRSLARLKPGAIILMHDGMPQTLQILPAFINEARRRGYQFVTMSQLARGD